MEWKKRPRTWIFAAALLLLVVTETPLVAYSYRFLQIMEASRGVQGVSGPMTLSERVLYSFLLADTQVNR